MVERLGDGGEDCAAPAPRQRGSSSGLRTIRESAEEYGRGVGGGLLFSLPLLYTMELWWAGFLAAPADLLAYIAVTFLLLLGYNRYAGLREDANWGEVAIDSVEEMGIGLLLAAVTLYLLGRITAEMSLLENLGRVVIASMTVAVGVSVGTAQLGGGGPDTGIQSRFPSPARTEAEDQDQAGPQRFDTVGQLVLAFCGAILFAANVAPTEEILMIGIEATAAKMLGLALLSLLTGTVILLFSGFRGAEAHVPHDGWLWAPFAVVTSYAAALLASALMLWFFGRFEGVSLAVAISQLIVLAFPAMLGASAGRLLIQ